jgi:hypothetical protein
MRQRCLNPKDPVYSNYGGRGITICPTWSDFTVFLADMGERPSKAYSLERLDVNGNYTPDNCVWATMSQQNRNRRNTKRFEYGGVSLTIVEWSERTGFPQNLIGKRLCQFGWSVERAVTEPKRFRSPRKGRAT